MHYNLLYDGGRALLCCGGRGTAGYRKGPRFLDGAGGGANDLEWLQIPLSHIHVESLSTF